MNSHITAFLAMLIASFGFLVSCSAVKHAGASSIAAVRKSSSAAGEKLASMAKIPDMPALLPGNRVKVVDVREKDLRELPTGRERAQQYQKQKSRGFWIFGGPVEFTEPNLPEAGTELDGSLLPPIPGPENTPE